MNEIQLPISVYMNLKAVLRDKNNSVIQTLNFMYVREAGKS